MCDTQLLCHLTVLIDKIRWLVTSNGLYVNIWGYRLMKSINEIYLKVTNVSVTNIMWDVLVITDRTILANWSDIVLHDKKERTCLLIDRAIPDNSNINTKEIEKLSKYKDMVIMVSRMLKVRTKIVPVIIWAVVTVKKGLLRLRCFRGVCWRALRRRRRRRRD
jgi:hypothetical protein